MATSSDKPLDKQTVSVTALFSFALLVGGWYGNAISDEQDRTRKQAESLEGLVRENAKQISELHRIVAIQADKQDRVVLDVEKAAKAATENKNALIRIEAKLERD